MASKNTKSHKVKGKLPNSAKKMKACADGNNEMFKRRRMPEPLVVQQMKVRHELGQRLRDLKPQSPSNLLQLLFVQESAV